MTTIFLNTQYEGVHYFPGAPDEVSYLRAPHRHMFHVQVEVEVFDDDREIEFIMLKHRVDEWIRSRSDANGVWQMGRMSCEQVAKQIINHLYTILDKPYRRFISVTVNEDGENGACVSIFPERK